MLAAGRRLGERPMWVHALALAALLLIVLPFTHPGGSLISDEGSAILEARSLARSGAWRVRAPLARFDPQDKADPLPYVDVGPKGRAPYAKHPLYPLLLAGAQRVAGRWGYYLLSVVGTVLGALGAAALARRMDVRPPLAFWIAGIGTPLWFYAFVVQGHSLGAASAVAATVVAWAALRRRTPWLLAALVVLVAIMSALRSEALLLAGAIGVAAIVVGWRRRWQAALVVAVTAWGAAVAVRAGETLFLRWQLGTGAGTTSTPGRTGGIFAATVHSFVNTWLNPTNLGAVRAGVALFVALGLVASAALLVRIGGRWSAVVLCLAGAGAGYLYWVVAGPPIPIEGLAIVFPAMWAGLWLLERGDFHSEVTRFVGIALLVFVVAVILTQSPGGGGPEWGGRYFVLALPMAVPLVAAVLGRVVGRGLGGLRYRATAASAVAVVTVLLAVAAVQSLHYANANAAALLKAVDKAGAEARAPFPGGADRRPVAVTTIPLIPQLLWEGYDRLRWLGPTETTLREYAARLARGNAQRIVLLTDDPKRDLDAVRPWFHEVDRPRIGLGRPPPHPVVVLQRS